LLDLARAAVEVEPTDPNAKPLETMSAEERIALYTALLREEEDGDGDDPEPTSPPAIHLPPRGAGVPVPARATLHPPSD
jgi:hypothetical protein